MNNRVIKISESQAREFINEMYPIDNNRTIDVNHGETVSVEGPALDSPDINPTPMTGDKFSDMRYNDLFHRLNGNGLGYNSFGFTVSDFDNVLGSGDTTDDDINIEYEDDED